jgi:hypothetical protein
MQLWFQLALWVYAEDVDAILGPLFILAIIVALCWFGRRARRIAQPGRPTSRLIGCDYTLAQIVATPGRLAMPFRIGA